MTAHPVDLVLVDGTDVIKSGVRGYAKERLRHAVADADEVRNTDLTGQYAGIHVRSLVTDYRLDPSDTTTADDGDNCIVDSEGNRFKKIVAAAGARTFRTITAAGDVNVAADWEDVILIKKTVGAATQVNLPDAGTRTKRIRIVDAKGDALANNITIVPLAGQTIWATVDYHAVIDSNGASYEIEPLPDGTGWT